MRYDNLIWDFDGTLFDTYPGMCRNLHRAVQQLGYDLPLEEITREFKISLDGAMDWCGEQTGLSPEVIRQAYRDQFTELGLPEAGSFPGVREILHRFQAAGGRNFVFTHRGKTVYEYLNGENLMPYFAEVVPFSSAFERKPSPSGNLYLIGKHGLETERTLAVGDRELDVLAAKGAGLDACLFVPMEVESAADYQIRTMEELAGILDLPTE